MRSMKTKREGQFQMLENTDVLRFGKYVDVGVQRNGKERTG